MGKRFKYTIHYGVKPVDDETADALPEKARAYFRKLTRTNPSAARLESKAQKLLAKVRCVTDFWRRGDEAKTYCDRLMRDLVDFFNRFNFYRFKNNAPDYMPYWALQLFSACVSVIGWADTVDWKREGVYQDDFVYNIAELYYRLTDEKEHGEGIYLCGVEI